MNDILTARLKECTTRIGSMCGDGRPPRMSVPVRDDDDDIFITTTCLQAAKEIDALRAEIERLNAGWYDKLLVTTLERDAQRKVLEQAKNALTEGYNYLIETYPSRGKLCLAAITAIQEQLNE